tara:strand:- start:356 stop:739 length:384 start_codon:yes stop_codon:yes gene_type:complete
VKIFYKMSLQQSTAGLEVRTDKYVSVHETECFHFCVHNYYNGLSYDKVKQRNIKVRRIDKRGSRFAFSTEKEAYANFLWLKKLQLNHLKRNIEKVNFFLSFEENKDLSGDFNCGLIPDSYKFSIQEY